MGPRASPRSTRGRRVPHRQGSEGDLSQSGRGWPQYRPGGQRVRGQLGMCHGMCATSRKAPSRRLRAHPGDKCPRHRQPQGGLCHERPPQPLCQKFPRHRHRRAPRCHERKNRRRGCLLAYRETPCLAPADRGSGHRSPCRIPKGNLESTSRCDRHRGPFPRAKAYQAMVDNVA